MSTPYAEYTIPYLTWLYASLVDGTRKAFAQHLDPAIAATNITVEFPTTEVSYPLIIVRYYGRSVKSAGVGETIVVEMAGQPPYYAIEYLYEGDVEFEIYTLDPLSRDRMADSIVHMLVAGQVDYWSNQFFGRLYTLDDATYPLIDSYYITVNTDEITPFGNVQVPNPWGAENDFLYKTTYRTNLLGQFFSFPITRSNYLNYAQIGNIISEVMLTGVDPSGNAGNKITGDLKAKPSINLVPATHL